MGERGCTLAVGKIENGILEVRLSAWTATATFVPLDIPATTNSNMTPEERPVNLDEVQAVIDSAKARGTGPLEKYVRDRMPEASEQEVQDAAEVALEIIETVPILLATAAK